MRVIQNVSFISSYLAGLTEVLSKTPEKDCLEDNMSPESPLLRQKNKSRGRDGQMKKKIASTGSLVVQYWTVASQHEILLFTFTIRILIYFILVQSSLW
jgi:hypothetical protein